MDKKIKKVSINLTEKEYELIERLATQDRRTISEISALILVDNATKLFEQRKGAWQGTNYCVK